MVESPANQADQVQEEIERKRIKMPKSKISIEIDRWPRGCDIQQIQTAEPVSRNQRIGYEARKR